MLKVTTTHMKQAFLQRNGIPSQPVCGDDRVLHPPRRPADADLAGGRSDLSRGADGPHVHVAMESRTARGRRSGRSRSPRSCRTSSPATCRTIRSARGIPSMPTPTACRSRRRSAARRRCIRNTRYAQRDDACSGRRLAVKRWPWRGSWLPSAAALGVEVRAQQNAARRASARCGRPMRAAARFEVLPVQGSVYLLAGAGSNITVQVGRRRGLGRRHQRGGDVATSARRDPHDLAGADPLHRQHQRPIPITSAATRRSPIGRRHRERVLGQGARVYAHENTYSRMANPTRRIGGDADSDSGRPTRSRRRRRRCSSPASRSR